MKPPARGPALGVDVRGSLNLVGSLLKYLSLATLFPTAFALAYSEPVWPFLLAGATGWIAGWALERLGGHSETVGVREGFLIVSLTWLVAAALGALPYVLSRRGSDLESD